MCNIYTQIIPEMDQFVIRLNLSKKNSGLTNKSLSEKLDVSHGTMRNYMSGRTPMPMSVIRDFASLLGINIEWLMNGTGDMLIDNSGQTDGNVEFIVSERPAEYDVKSKKKLIQRLSIEAMEVLFNEIEELKSRVQFLEKQVHQITNQN